MVGGEDEDSVLLDAGLAQRFEEIADAIVECGDMGAVARDCPFGFLLVLLRHIRPQQDVLGLEQIPILLWRRLVGVVRRAPGQHQQKRRTACVIADVPLGLARLGDRIIAFPFELEILVAVVEGIVVGVGAAQDLPEIESLPPLGRDERAATVAVEMPLADIGGFVARAADRLPPGIRPRSSGAHRSGTRHGSAGTGPSAGWRGTGCRRGSRRRHSRN